MKTNYTTSALFLVMRLLLPCQLEAQDKGRIETWSAPSWVGDIAFLSLNTLTSGLAAGGIRRLTGGSFSDGFAGGAFGGALHYAGMRTSSRRFDGAGLIGRQISAAGIAATRNAADGRPPFEQLWFPLGPLHLYLDFAEGPVLRPKISAAASVGLVVAALERDLTFDVGESLSAGAPVFYLRDRQLMHGGAPANGVTMFGTIFLSNLQSAELREQVLAHERVHVSQRDWRFLVFGEPVEDKLVSFVPGGSEFYRFIDIDIATAWLPNTLYRLFNVPKSMQLHEVEADYLEVR